MTEEASTNPGPEGTSGPPPARRRRAVWVWFLVAAALAAGGVWAWAHYKSYIIPKRFGVVKEGKIYRCGQLYSTLVKSVLEKRHVRVIVDLTMEEPDNPHQAAEARAAKELGIERLRFPLNGDGTGDIRQYAGALAAICRAEKEGKPVLVHCAAGAQRTGGTIAIYRLFLENRPVDEVMKEMARYGWRPGKNTELPHYLNLHMVELARLLVENGVLKEAPKELPVFEGY
jgi:protein tyrosine phosphatase (PTP) superfamily phosphohydrolase (DUF442 family)